MMIVNDATSWSVTLESLILLELSIMLLELSIMLLELSIMLLQASLMTIIIYDHHIFIVQATGVIVVKLLFFVINERANKLECLSQASLNNLV